MTIRKGSTGIILRQSDGNVVNEESGVLTIDADKMDTTLIDSFHARVHTAMGVPNELNKTEYLFAIADAYGCVCKAMGVPFAQACAILNSVFEGKGRARSGDVLTISFDESVKGEEPNKGKVN